MADEYGLDEIAFDVDADFVDPDADDAQQDQEIINTPWDDGTHAQGESVSQEELARYRQYEQVVNQFNSNPVASLQQLAQQVGMELRPAGSGAAPTAPSKGAGETSSMEQDIADLIEDDSLKFLAPVIAKVSNAIAEKRLKEEVEPLKTAHKEILTRNRQQEYAFAAGELAKKHPEWSSHEQDMANRLAFIKDVINGGQFIHPKYGNFLEVVYDWAAGRNNAVRQVAADYRDAPRHRAPSSSTSQNGQPNILQLIAKEKDPRKAERLAFDDAVRRVIG
jgi:hypothetical protein